SFLTAVLQKYPHTTGILYDLPHVVESGRPLIAAAGLGQRCDLVGGDIFQAVPAGGDAYLLRWVIHNWDDDRAVAILRHCRRVMKDTGRLLLVEMVLPPGDEPHTGWLSDFLMLIALGGQERTAEEYTALLREAGFRLNRVVPTASPMSVLEGVAK